MPAPPRLKWKMLELEFKGLTVIDQSQPPMKFDLSPIESTGSDALSRLMLRFLRL